MAWFGVGRPIQLDDDLSMCDACNLYALTCVAETWDQSKRNTCHEAAHAGRLLGQWAGRKA
jgi:hypothetical protein